jgi:serine/threonine-protein kinase
VTPGTRLGPYEIIVQVGAGGMGEVYRARDTKLDRDVAIKILPNHLAADPERVARFEREAKTLAALNHPHIAAIYGFEEANGLHALVMELVEGPTLANRITQGPIPIDEALPIAKQIAEALEGAHEQGFIHRDLKPANVKVRTNGTVKVLDFGLAKAMEPADTAASSFSMRATITTPAMTQAGIILGTAAYMSPEQARGQAVDKRTDIWAFGCVLYEMLTGRVAFREDTISDTIAAILGREPEWSALKTPASLRRVLQRCLAKDPRRRFHDIADLRIEIEDVMSGEASSSADATTVNAWRQPVRWLGSVAAVVALVAVGALTWSLQKAGPTTTEPPRVSRTTIASSGTAALGIANDRSLAMTPDGTRVVYVGIDNRLMVQALDRLDATAIYTAAAPLNWVFVSPDGRWVGFAEARELKKVAITGGPAETIALTDLMIGATWAPDDSIIFSTRDEATGLQRVSANRGNVDVLTQPMQARGERDHLWPEMLPAVGPSSLPLLRRLADSRLIK